MTSSFRSTSRTVGAPNTPERIRREWQDFQPWLAVMRSEEEARKRRELEELKKTNQWRIKTQGSHSDTITTIEADFEKERKALRDRMKTRVESRAKEEWDLRLRQANLKMEQWTDITQEENAAVAAVMWGVTNEYEDSIIVDASEEAEIDTSSSSITPTPSMSSRGPQLWTPPDISQAAELPATHAYSTRPSSDGQQNDGDKTPTARWIPYSAQSNAGQTATTPAKTLAEEWWTQNRVPEQASKTRSRVTPKLAEWTDDNSTILGSAHEATKDEFYYNTDEETELKAPANQKVPLYEKWKPPETDANSRPTVSAQRKAPVQLKSSAQWKTPSQPNTQTTSNAHVAAPRIRPAELASASPDPESDSERNLRNQVDESYGQMYNEAQECYQKALRDAPEGEAVYERLIKERTNILGMIRRIADDMYLVKFQLATLQSTQDKQERSRSKANSHVTADNRSMNSGQFDGPRRTPNTTPPSPLTPPHTPHSATRYIGPILTDDEEEDLFDGVSFAIRNQKIVEFHEEAAVLDIRVAERLHEHKKDKRDKKLVGVILTQHQQKVEDLRKAKEKERKDATDAERKRRRAEIDDARNRESAGQGDTNHKHAKQQPRSGSSQQKGKEDQNRPSESSSAWSRPPPGTAVDMQTSINGSNSRRPGVAKQANRHHVGSHGLFSTDHADRKQNGKGTDQPHVKSRHSSKITPLAPTVGLPEIDSDDGENGESAASSSDDDFLPGASNKHVRFTPTDNSTDYNVQGLRPGLDSESIGGFRAMPSGSGSGKGPAARGTTRPAKIRRIGPGESREERNMEIWYPTEEVK